MIKEAPSKDGEVVWSLEESYPVMLLLVGEEGGKPRSIYVLDQSIFKDLSFV